MITRRFSRGAQTLGLQVIPFEQRSDFDADRMRPDSLVWQAVDTFTTHGGSWEVVSEAQVKAAPDLPHLPAELMKTKEAEFGDPFFGIEKWARDAYLFPPEDPRYLTEGGADHNILVCVLNTVGERLAGAGVAFTSDGVAYLQPPSGPAVVVNTKSHGWCDVAMYSSSLSYPPALGPWSVTKLSEVNAADLVVGMGMPWLWHVSQFIVYRAMRWDAYLGQAGTLEGAMKAAAQAAQVIQFNPDAALQKAIYADGFHINSPEFDLTFGGVTYRCQRAEHLGTGLVRCYYCAIPNWDIVEHIDW